MTQQSRNPLAARGPGRPPTAGVTPGRRSVVGGVFGLGAAVLGAPLLTACGGGAGADPKTVTFGSNGADATPKSAYAAVTKAFTKDSGLTVKTNTVDHDTFQKSISTYLQGTPDDVFTWFAGYRMQYFAKKKLCSPLDEVWDKIGAGFSDATKQLSRGEDGKYYFVPLYNYPWAVFYRKSVFKERGYQIPQKWSEFIALAKQMKKDGLSPIASGYGGGDSWSILGAFDYVNMRTNGYDFHMSLMRGKVSWTDKRAVATLDHWRELAPHYQQGAGGRSWQDAAQSLLDKKSGMAVIGLFLGQQITDEKIRSDIDFFPFPRSTPPTARMPSRPPPTASCSAGGPRTRTAPRSSWSSSAGPAPRRCTWASTRATSPSTRRPTPARTTRCRRSPPTSSPPPSTSASSRTVTATRASSPPSCSPA